MKRKIICIAGTRDLNISNRIIYYLFQMLEFNCIDYSIISGESGKVDLSAKYFACFCNYVYDGFKADWKEYGKSAGPKRNRQMAEVADILLLIWDGKSRGSKNMRSEMLKRNKPVYEFIINRPIDNHKKSKVSICDDLSNNDSIVRSFK